MTLTDTNNSAVLEVVPTLDPIDSVDVTGMSVARTQNSVDPDNVDTSKVCDRIDIQSNIGGHRTFYQGQ